MRTRIKFCGFTRVDDVADAIACGVDAIGVIFAAASPRRVPAQRAREIARSVPPLVTLVAVFVNPSASDVAAASAAGFLPQYSGEETADQCEAFTAGSYIKVQHIAPDAATPKGRLRFDAASHAYRRATWMFDTAVAGQAGGTGRTFDWTVARELAGDRRIIMSGGLGPANVAACVRAVRPYGVDVRSGIETDGVKDRSKMRAFVRAVREADEQT